MKKVNIAVIGTGRMGSVHVRNLVRQIPEANLVALCDLRLDVAQALADELGIAHVVRDYHELLADKSIEAMLIATNTDTHAYVLKDVAAAKKHIFCEKPLAFDLQSIDEELEAVEKAGVKLQVGFNRRFDKSMQQVHKTVASGEIGRPCILHIVSRDPELPTLEYLRTSGGMFLDMTIHDFDMARFQVGEVEEVYAVGSALLEPRLNEFGDVDTNIVTLTFKNGAVGTIDNSRRAVFGYDQRLEVFCSKGTAMAANEVENTLIKGDASGFHHSVIPNFFMQRYAPCYVEEVRQFIAAVRDNTPIPTSGRDGRQAVVLAIAAWKSLKEKRPVKISEVEAA
jgi:myo-inositol 2-dehydrogenase / D-chiro-inositol 1-dehydrogenase